ncbi:MULTISPECIES: glycosyltransferase family 2 protein [Paenibacillus]|uniref:glycosyltransferase family 2 protein n=1 Tax=Paenibacillus TaxID=44249 RepID=UPI0022B8CD60|nr:glycosyltransferase [Paenibacillus caseinilyticus]MCZ8519164.1 glycosyltransferase [Paenibacillus caseinilyticus]
MKRRPVKRKAVRRKPMKRRPMHRRTAGRRDPSGSRAAHRSLVRPASPLARVSVIIPVMNEGSTLPALLREVKKLKPSLLEILVVVNGSTDGSREIAERAGARVFFYEEALGHDVGRSIGARHAAGDILLFLDADMVLTARQLRPFIRAVGSGTDVALNAYLGPLRRRHTHPVVLAKHALNLALGRPDLRGASLTTVPHALSRRALEAVGAEALAVPPKAQAMAVHHGLRVEPAALVPVGKLNRLRGRRGAAEGQDEVGRLIVGDHLEAVAWLTEATDMRGGFTDLNRMRHAVR